MRHEYPRLFQFWSVYSTGFLYYAWIWRNLQLSCLTKTTRSHFLSHMWRRKHISKTLNGGQATCKRVKKWLQSKGEARAPSAPLGSATVQLGKKNDWLCATIVKRKFPGEDKVWRFFRPLILSVIYGSIWKSIKNEKQKWATEKEQSTSERSSYKQITLHKTTDRTKVWETNDPRAVRISTSIGDLNLNRYLQYLVKNICKSK